MATYGHGACTLLNTETMGKSSSLSFSFHFSTDNQSQSTPTTGRPRNNRNHSGPRHTHPVSRAATRASSQHLGWSGMRSMSPHIGRWQNSPAPRGSWSLWQPHTTLTKAPEKLHKQKKKFQSNKVEKPNFQYLFFRLPVLSAVSHVQQAPVLLYNQHPRTSMFPSPLLKTVIPGPLACPWNPQRPTPKTWHP